MIFVRKEWKKFCRKLKNDGHYSITASQVTKDTAENYLVLKHDVETNVKKAFKIAKIENDFGHCGSYYVQAYLLKNSKNVALLSKMREMGHEISYHYDVMDSNRGDIQKAVEEFELNKQMFEKFGFEISTVCQHGNPVVNRVGYTSNRDFFRNENVQKRYAGISDIMVNFQKDRNTEYRYYSDAGRKFNFIYDPINNDVCKSDDKNIAYQNLEALYSELVAHNSIISIHPHRWESNAVTYWCKNAMFQCIRFAAKLAMKIPFLKKIMSKYYFLAKKI